MPPAVLKKPTKLAPHRWRTSVPNVKVSQRSAVIGFGSNLSGSWGDPQSTIAKALNTLDASGLRVTAVSGIYKTHPIGGGRQPPFFNAVARVDLDRGLASLLRFLKKLERDAGRRLGRHWGPRPLDLDILDAAVVLRHRPAHLAGPTSRPRPTGRLILPHPEMHRRAFVLIPLNEIAPHWRHPILKSGIRRLIAGRSIRSQLVGLRRLAGQDCQPVAWPTRS